MPKAVAGAAIIGLGVAATLASGGVLGPVAEGLAGMAISSLGTSAAGFSAMAASLAATGVSMEAGAIAGALTSNRGVNITTRQPAANRQIVYGQQRVGGIYIYKSTTGSHLEQLNFVLVLAGHECDSIVNLYLDGRQIHWAGGVGNSTRNGVNFGGAADGNTYTGPDGIQYNFGGAVYAEARYGDQLEGDVIGGLTANDPVWAAGANGSPWVGGCTYIYLKVESNATLFPSEPEVRVTVNGKNNIWDPRTQSYGFTSNWALCAGDVITDPVFGLGDNTVNQAQLIAAANVCDEQVALGVAPGNLTEARYATNYHYDTSVTPGTALDTMMAGAGGRVSWIGGEWYLWPAYWQGPTFSCDDNILIGQPQWKPYRSVRDLVNRVNGTYIAPTYPYNIAGNLYDLNGFYNGQIQNNFALAFTQTNFPQYAADKLHGYPSDEWTTADGGIQHPMELSLATVLSIGQAQRLAKIALMRNRQQGSGTLEMGLGAYGLQPTDVMQLTFGQANWTNKVLEVVGTSFSVVDGDEGQALSIHVSYHVQETDPSVYEWSTTEELTVYDVPATPSQTPLTPAPPTEMTLNSGPSVAQINPDGTVNNLIVVGWNTPLDNLAIGIQIQYQLTGAAEWLSAPNADISLNTQWISNVVPGQFYNVQIRSYRANGTASDWVSQDNYEVVPSPTFLGTLSAQIPVLTQSVGTTYGELIINGNFANGLTDWSTGFGSPVIDTTQFKIGTQSVRFQGVDMIQNVNLIGGHTYELSTWVQTNGSVITNGSLGAGIYIADPTGQITIQKASGTVANAGNTNPGVLITASGATGWTLLQMTFSVATTGTYLVVLTDVYGVSVGSATHTWFDGASLTDTTGGADVTSAQPSSTSGSSESIVNNGSFQLNNIDGWFLAENTGPNTGFAYSSAVPGLLINGGGNQGIGSPTFAVIPGQKYRINFDCWAGAGTQQTYFRISYSATNQTQITATNRTGSADFLSAGTISTNEEIYPYDWTCPAGVYYASLSVYSWGNTTAQIAVKSVVCIPYAAAGEYGADVTTNQPIVYAASSESIVINGNFVMGNMTGWTQTAFSYGADGFGPRIYAPSGLGSAGSPAFQIVPGEKYRFVFTCYNGGGSGGIYFRIAWQGKTTTIPANVIPGGSAPGAGFGDFMSNGSVTTSPTGYVFDNNGQGWTAPAGACYASMWMYDIGGSDLACQKVECFPYVAVGQYGADVTSGNTSNDTSHVDGVPSSTIAQVVPTGFELFINNGARQYSFQALS